MYQLAQIHIFHGKHVLRLHAFTSPPWFLMLGCSAFCAKYKTGQINRFILLPYSLTFFSSGWYKGLWYSLPERNEYTHSFSLSLTHSYNNEFKKWYALGFFFDLALMIVKNKRVTTQPSLSVLIEIYFSHITFVVTGTTWWNWSGSVWLQSTRPATRVWKKESWAVTVAGHLVPLKRQTCLHVTVESKGCRSETCRCTQTKLLVQLHSWVGSSLSGLM